MGTPIYYARNGRDDAFWDSWQRIQERSDEPGEGWDAISEWRDAVAEWRLAREQYDADPTSEWAWHRLKAAESRITDLRHETKREFGAVISEEIDDAERRLLAAYDATGRWLHRLAWALAAVAVIGWWWAWR